MATQKTTASNRAPSRKGTPTKVSYAEQRKEMARIAQHAFSRAFDEMFNYAVRVSPNGHSFVRQYLTAMRECLEWHEARQPGRARS